MLRAKVRPKVVVGPSRHLLDVSRLLLDTLERIGVALAKGCSASGLAIKGIRSMCELRHHRRDGLGWWDFDLRKRAIINPEVVKEGKSRHGSRRRRQGPTASQLLAATHRDHCGSILRHLFDRIVHDDSGALHTLLSQLVHLAASLHRQAWLRRDAHHQAAAVRPMRAVR